MQNLTVHPDDLVTFRLDEELRVVNAVAKGPGITTEDFVKMVHNEHGTNHVHDFKLYRGGRKLQQKLGKTLKEMLDADELPDPIRVDTAEQEE